MAKYTLVFTRQAEKDLRKIRAAGLAPKVERLLEVLRSNPFTTYPRYEALSGDLKGYYSRRINIHHRLLYTVDTKKHVVAIFRAWTHYDGMD
ncbi:Txe/YoeB family addiction module toxin [Candidatus Saccharibacteria bacterium]|nr:Txe/YoeB family addiction module toxin [Candidatus Saccharibacteria bacterium]